MNDFIFNLPHILDQVIQSVPVIKPEITLIIAFLGAIIASLFIDPIWKHSSFAIAVSGLLISLLCLHFQVDSQASGFFDMLRIDNFSVYARMIACVALLISVIYIQQHFRTKAISKNLGDLYPVLLGIGIGIYFLTATTNWLLAYIAIEMVSIGSYILVGFFSENKRQSEAAMKYALFGAVCSAVMLYGLSLIYGFTGNLDFATQEHLQGLLTAPKMLCTIAILFVLTGIGFKLSFVPFHVWTPDVYEGAPTPITAFLSTVPKIGALVLFARVIQSWMSTQFYFSEIVFIYMIVVAVVTMLAGNLIALRQQNVKRMMAYSSIGHTGFLLMALLAVMTDHHDIILYYLAVYTLMNLAVFAFIDSIEQKYGTTNLSDYAGLGKQFPILFSSFTFVGISLVGLPPTAGFLGKLFVFTTTFELYQGTGDFLLLILLIVGALTSVISLFYYFRIPLYAFLRKGNEQNGQSSNSSWSLVAVIGVLLAVLILLFGIFPGILLNYFV